MSFNRVAILGIMITILAAAGWRISDRYERGILYPWVEALIYADNPHDGIYVMNVDKLEGHPNEVRIRDSIERALEPPSFVIDRHRASFRGYVIQTPTLVGATSLEVCIQDDENTLHLTATRWGAKRYCHADTDAAFVVIMDGKGGLVCEKCEQIGMPLHYKLVP